jgi:hypothetical protein
MRLILLAILLPLSAHAQSNVADILFSDSHSVNYQDVRQCTLREVLPLRKFVMRDASWRSSCHDSLSLEGDSSSLTLFRFVDFSGDGVNDLIYTSYCMSETQMNFLWRRVDDSLHFVGSCIGTLLYLYRSNVLEPYSLVVVTGYCCAGYVGDYDSYRCEEATNSLRHEPLLTVREFDETVFPKTKMTPIAFVVAQEGYRLRSSPMIVDSVDTLASEHEEVEVRGNTLARFTKGSKGIAVAKQTDSTGRVWWFVIMDRKARTIYSRFYGDSQASVCGWMSSRFLSRLN